jgi:hypothetical protein
MKPDLETVEESETKKFGLWTKFSNANSVRIKNLQLEIVNTKSRRDALSATKACVAYLSAEAFSISGTDGAGEISWPRRIATHRQRSPQASEPHPAGCGEHLHHMQLDLVAPS